VGTVPDMLVIPKPNRPSLTRYPSEVGIVPVISLVPTRNKVSEVSSPIVEDSVPRRLLERISIAVTSPEVQVTPVHVEVLPEHTDATGIPFVHFQEVNFTFREAVRSHITGRVYNQIDR